MSKTRMASSMLERTHSRGYGHNARPALACEAVAVTRAQATYALGVQRFCSPPLPLEPRQGALVMSPLTALHTDAPDRRAGSLSRYLERVCGELLIRGKNSALIAVLPRHATTLPTRI